MAASPQEAFPANPEVEDITIPLPEELVFLGFTPEGLKDAFNRVRVARYNQQLEVA